MECVSTFVVSLPISRPERPRRPCEDMTIRSQRLDFAAFRMPSQGESAETMIEPYGTSWSFAETSISASARRPSFFAASSCRLGITAGMYIIASEYAACSRGGTTKTPVTRALRAAASFTALLIAFAASLVPSVGTRMCW